MALVNTKGIVLRTMKYRETSLICDIFTRELGMRSYLVQGVRKKKSRIGAGFFQPMQVLDLVVYENPGSSLNRIKEVNASALFLELQSNIPKSAVGLFIAELARKSVRESSPNEELYDFLEQMLGYLEHTNESLQLLPLWMGMKMTHYLGFSPNRPDQSDDSMYFDLRDGVLVNSKPNHPDLVTPPMALSFVELADAQLSDLANMNFSRQDRDLLFDKMIDYYKLHIEHLGRLKTPEIFRELF